MPKALPPDLHDGPEQGHSLARHYARGVRIDAHAHEWAQVLYAVAGVMWVEVGREALLVPPQRAVWLPAGTVHSIHMMSAVEMRNLYLHEQNVQPLSRQSGVFEVNGLLRELITTLAEQARDPAYRQLAYRLVVLELAHAARYALRIRLPGSADRRLEVLCRAVIDNPSAELGFEHHAAAVGASVRTLARLFARELGMSFVQWRRQVQLAVAVSRLAEGRSVSHVARSLGYLPSSFSDMFRRELGASPTALRPDETLRAERRAPGDEAGLRSLDAPP
jgi:AraC-like DNA-binding protein